MGTSVKGKAGPKRGGGKPGFRSILAVVLIGFVLLATGVIARRVYGVSQSTKLRDMKRRLEALDADRIRLDGEIREASSRARLQPIAEQRLHMHIALPEQQVFLPRSSKTPETRPPNP